MFVAENFIRLQHTVVEDASSTTFDVKSPQKFFFRIVVWNPITLFRHVECDEAEKRLWLTWVHSPESISPSYGLVLVQAFWRGCRLLCNLRPVWMSYAKRVRSPCVSYPFLIDCNWENAYFCCAKRTWNIRVPHVSPFISQIVGDPFVIHNE